MSHDDPFASPDADRTIIIPTPGGRGGAMPPAPAPAPAGVAFVDDAALPNAGLNPLLAAANPLLDLVPQLRGTLQHADPAGLRDSLARSIKSFEARAKGAGIANEKVIAARYALCTLLDETAASTPWGGSGIWAKHSLLVMFHNENWGGEKFFQLLSKLAENPVANRDLLELMYVCLSLGLEGRYRVAENGKAQLETLRERLAQMIKKQQGEYERDLSAHSQPAVVQRSRVLTLLPVWVVVAVAGLLMVAVYLALAFRLNTTSDPVFAQINGIRIAAAPPPKPPAPAPKPRLATFLAEEVRQGLVTVRDDADRSVVTIKGDGLFPPGSASISESYLPLLDRIGAALNDTPGLVQVTGHTDNQPIRSARFPSNWHLSQERARSVMQLLARKLAQPTRVSAEGRADSEPVAPNDNPANRARNRRVEITLFVSQPGSKP
jgi:type VI secretion system protein ImpK